MFWRTRLYDTPLPAPSFQDVLRTFAENNHFTMSGSEQAGKYILKTPETPGKYNACSIHIEYKDQHPKRFYKVQVVPNNWILGLMLLLILTAVAAYVKPSQAGFLGYSIPFLIVIPYMYALYVHRLLMDVKGILLPGYFETAEGKKEMFKGYMAPLRIFLKGQMVLYIGFVVIFIGGMVLWMFGVFDTINITQLMKRFFKVILSTCLLLLINLPAALQCKAQTLYAFQDTVTELYGYQTKGKVVKIPAVFPAIEKQSFKRFAFVAADSSWIGINRQGEFLFKAYVIDNGPDMFSNGRCRIILNNKIGYINNKGVIVIAPQYNYAEKFKKRRAKVSQVPRHVEHDPKMCSHYHYTYDVIDRSGRLIWDKTDRDNFLRETPMPTRRKP